MSASNLTRGVYSKVRPLLVASADARLMLTRNYHEKVIDHYENPRNVGSFDKSDASVGTGLVGAPACGDVMKLQVSSTIPPSSLDYEFNFIQIKVDENGKITDAKFKTFGCGSAIASSSLATEWIKGKSIQDANGIKNQDIAKELCLPPVKLHCSSKIIPIVKANPHHSFILVLAEDAIKAAINDYNSKKDKQTKSN